MHKEVLIAIVFGSLLGLVVAFGVWKANSALKIGDEKMASEEQEPGEENKEVEELDLGVVKPADKEVSTVSPIGVSGISSAANYVVVLGEEEDAVLKPEKGGEFETEIELVGGVNEILIWAFGKTQVVDKKVMVLYSTQLGKDSEAAEENESTSSAEAEEVINVPRAYLGTVTDITEDAIQIRSNEGEIKQVSMGEKTSYANIVKEAKEVEKEDVAIGDFVIAMGYFSGENGVLEAARILITTPIEASGRKALRGIVSEVGKKTLTLGAGGEVQEIDISGKISMTKEDDEGNLVAAKLSDIGQGKEIIVVVEEEAAARMVHILTSLID